ncbi:MAG: radical SAM protein [Desulfobulbaceae bacterium]
MSRKILLIEPNYRNKYPPMGLMKLATYYRNRGDDVRFFKGDLKVFAAKLLCEEFLAEVKDPKLGKHVPKLIGHIKTGKFAPLDAIPNFRNSEQDAILKEYRLRYRDGKFPLFDVVGVTTLFTFYWRETIDTINYAKRLCSEEGRIIVGGIAASILHDKILRETGIDPLCGLLNRPAMLDADSEDIINELPLDYSILEEIDYQYPASNAYLAYMTRGCPRKCAFCAVPRLEPEYKDYIELKEQIRLATERFGPQKDLLLMDNNVFASKHFDKIIDEIKECGFQRGATYIPESEYNIAMRNIREGYNVRAYTRKLIRLYDSISARLPEADQADFYLEREKRNLLYAEVASPDAIIEFNERALPLYEKYFKRIKRIRIIDFNQGVDARLVTDKKMKKLSEINIRPLRIAFDHYSMKDTYEAAIRTAAKHGITNLSNYLLYNFEDNPDDLYYRMKLNVDLCDELGVTIYSFPMKYHPIDDPEYFQNRDYTGKHWNRKFIRSVQAVLNSTKGKIGRGKSFFDEAFGENIEGFHKILWMPEAFIIHRFKYKDNLTAEWWVKFNSLNEVQLNRLKEIVAGNLFNKNIVTGDPATDEVLRYYQVRRDPK